MGLIVLLMKSVMIVASLFISIFLSAYVMVVRNQKTMAFFVGLIFFIVTIFLLELPLKFYFIIILVSILIYFNVRLVEKTSLHSTYLKKK